MIRLWKLNGSPLAEVFNRQAKGSEIYLSKLSKDSRQRLINLAVGKNFSQVIFINPDLTPALIESVESLAQAFISKIFVISNENILRTSNADLNSDKQTQLKARALYDPWPGEKIEWTVNDLLARLPKTVICRTREYSLLNLIAELIKQTNFQSQKDLIVVNFSLSPVLAALKLLGFPYELNDSEKNQANGYDYWGEFKNPPNPLSQLAILVQNLAQDRLAQHTGADKQQVFEPILKDLLAV